MCKTLLCYFSHSGIRLLADMQYSHVSQKSKIWFLLLLVFFSKFQNFKEFLNYKISIWCLWHYYITSIVQVWDFWLTREFCVSAKSLTPEGLKLHNSVKHSNCLFYHLRNLSKFQLLKKTLKWINRTDWAQTDQKLTTKWP